MQNCNTLIMYKYRILLKTGDRLRAGTSGHVYVVLHGKENQETPPTKVDAVFYEAFERGQTYYFTVKNVKFEKVSVLEIWSDDAGLYKEWRIDTVTIENLSGSWDAVFPVFRWIRSNFHYKFRPNDTCLPQDDMFPEQHTQELEEKRTLYKYSQLRPGFPVQVSGIPIDEEFSFSYQWDITRKMLFLRSRKLWTLFRGDWQSVEDVESIYDDDMFPRPSDCTRWLSDEKFGQQRFDGLNSMVIRLCTVLPPKMAVDDEMMRPFLQGLSLEDAIKSKRTFVIDHSIMDGVTTRPGVFSCAPIALFFRRDDGKIVPAAIQLFQHLAPDNPVFLPSDPKYTWILAKMWFNCADAQVHQWIAHLGFTNIIMEGFVIATHRHLSQSHPIFKLLAPHFLYLIDINHCAVWKLMNPGGHIDNTFSVGKDGGAQLIGRHRPLWRLDVDGTLPADLRARGVEDPEVVPDYPCRDDALLTYNAIRSYVGRYVQLYYGSDDVLINDSEIQSWRRDLDLPMEAGGLGIKGVPGSEGKFTTRDQLITVLTSIIYTCSVGHASVNSKQYDEYAFPMNYPSWLKGDPPKDKSAKTERDILDAIHPRKAHREVMSVSKILSERSTRPLGDFAVDYVYDPPAVQIQKEFRAELKNVSDVIKRRNETRECPYPYLDPAVIPNSISISDQTLMDSDTII
ncbi:polyunsaturated fatty acid 5-lipoxygenase-like [Mya arenaria]|uniref:polyunsaturated fatty acid 5-lipoxygenase-like n=1 Tax=Mya arenaria TaxID=6604 RepID=UPI0022E07EA1|nr:polyunsaturated fatty acid 5-lipoxygenase-like [Mya arenaria]